jgi:hypothetical protein
MSLDEPQATQTSITESLADAKPALPSDDAERQSPRSPKAGIRTGVHWRPGPASAWSFMTDGESTPVKRTP